jgi:hypothetical protein
VILPQCRGASLVLTLDDWHPSHGRDNERPLWFRACENLDACRHCLAKTSEQRERDDENAWRRGGHVECRLYVYPEPVTFGTRTCPDGPYVAKVTFWGLDDTGMERFFRDEESARWFVCHLPVFVTREWLTCVGFIAC